MIIITHQPPDDRTGICIEWSAEHGYYIEHDGKTVTGATLREAQKNFEAMFPDITPSYYISPSVSFHQADTYNPCPFGHSPRGITFGGDALHHSCGCAVLKGEKIVSANLSTH